MNPAFGEDLFSQKKREFHASSGWKYFGGAGAGPRYFVMISGPIRELGR